jgi:FlaA1/EpsC-like NDP-sugar epimerase
LSYRRLIVVVFDLAATALAVFVSFLLRLGAYGMGDRLEETTAVCVILVPAAAVCFWMLRLDRSPWKFVSVSDLRKIIIASSTLTAVLIAIQFLSGGAVFVPRTVPGIFWFVEILFLAAPRMLYRTLRMRKRNRKAFQGVYRIPVLVAGIDDEAETLVRRLQRDTVLPMEVVGLLAPRARDIGARIQDTPVVGTFMDLEKALDQLNAKQIEPKRLIVTRGSLNNADIEALLGEAQRKGLAAVRPFDTLASVDVSADALQLAPISIEDLLGRSTRNIDLAPLRELVAKRKVIVTGAGGSIGSELCRQIAAMEPAKLILLDHSELALYTIFRELAVAHPSLETAQVLGNVVDRKEIFEVFHKLNPDLVFHAAALKHVDIVENHTVAGTQINAIGTRHVADAARDIKAICAVFISTDKAVNPVSVLGATKRAGELYWASCDQESGLAGAGTRFLTVRFGNVLGSNGSVIPLFTEQLKQGGPITVTHPDIERYFMTISEAVTLVLMSSALGVKSPERSPTFVLDMGKPVKIVELARRMIRLSGLEPDRDIPIVFTGLRPGERLTEPLEYSDEKLAATTIPGVRATNAQTGELKMMTMRFGNLEKAVATRDEDAVKSALKLLVPEYRPKGRDTRDTRAADTLSAPSVSVTSGS